MELECWDKGGRFGWCGTCTKSKDKGKPGYCGADQAIAKDKERFEAEKSRPTEFGGWGFCGSHCNKRLERQPVLKESMRRVWTERNCHTSDDDETTMKTQICIYQLQRMGQKIRFK